MKRYIKSSTTNRSWNQAKQMYDKLSTGEESYIRLWDEVESNRIISIKSTDESYAIVEWEDTVNGTSGCDRMYWSEVVDLIAENIKTAEFV